MRYGIFNHTTPEGKNRPLASVAFLPCENVIERGPLYDAMIEFTENSYKEIWGYTFSEFMGLPQWKVRMLREVTQEVMAKRETALNNAKKGLGVP